MDDAFEAEIVHSLLPKWKRTCFGQLGIGFPGYGVYYRYECFTSRRKLFPNLILPLSYMMISGMGKKSGYLKEERNYLIFLKIYFVS